LIDLGGGWGQVWGYHKADDSWDDFYGSTYSLGAGVGGLLPVTFGYYTCDTSDPLLELSRRRFTKQMLMSKRRKLK